MAYTFGRGTRRDSRFGNDEKVIRLYETTKETKHGPYTFLRGAFRVMGRLVRVKVARASEAAKAKSKRENFSHWMQVKARPARAGFSRGRSTRRFTRRAPRARRGSFSRAPRRRFTSFARRRRRY